MANTGSPKVAIIYDWLTNMGGAERVVLALHQAYPDAPIFTSVFNPKACPEFANLDVRTSYLQKLPSKLRYRHQLFPLLRANAFRRLNLRDYDIVISSASAEAKAVQVRPGAIHICYCHPPTRYYWSHYKEYLSEPGFGLLNPAVRVALPMLVRLMRRSDLKAVTGVTRFIANSSAVAERIKTFYGRDSVVLNPPVDMQRFRSLNITGQRHGFVALGRQVHYKRIDLAIKACSSLGTPLTVYGNGPDYQRLRELAGPTVKFITNATDEQVALALSKAEAFLFPQEEDFGIVQIEAMAAGCPVIAYAKGGALDATIDGKTGLLFAQQTAESLEDAIRRFQSHKFDPLAIQLHAEKFSQEKFISKIHQLVKETQEQNR
jgi:glycosyltransferase involved in cell wall biosynthesis